MATVQGKDIAALFNNLRDQRDKARAETTRTLAALVACQDERAALRAKVALLEAKDSEADELRVTLAQLRELYVDREHDLAHEFKRARDAEAELDALRSAITEMAELYKRHEGKYGGTGVADELDLILSTNQELVPKSDAPSCETCGSTYRVTFEPDPYQEDINNDHTSVWECAKCRTESAADI